MAIIKLAIDYDDDDPSGVRTIEYDDGGDEVAAKDDDHPTATATASPTANKANRLFLENLTTELFHQQKDVDLKLQTMKLNPTHDWLHGHVLRCEECGNAFLERELGTFFLKG
jgi:hypothetical protein